MSQHNSNSENYRDDEIDLRKLFQAIGSGFANIGKGFVNLIIRIKRATLTYKYLLLVMIVVGLVTGILLNKVSKPYYKTSMLLSSEYFNARLVNNSIEKLNALCVEEGRVKLSSILNITLEEANNIKEFEYEPLVSEQDILEGEVLKQKLEGLKVKDVDISYIINQIQIQNQHTYRLTVHVFDITIIGDFQDALVDYFKNNPFVKNRIKINKANKIELIAKLKSDISQLDSLKHLFNMNLKASADRTGEAYSNVYVGESSSLEPISFYNRSVILYNQLQSIEKEVELGEDFEVIDGFAIYSKPESPSTKKATLFTGLLFLGLAYLLIIFIEINKYLNKVEKERFQTNS